MNRFFIVYCLISTMSILNSSCAQDTAQPSGRDRFFSRPAGTRSIWVWESINILQSKNEQQKFIDLLNTPPGNGAKITNVYFSSNVNFLRSETLKPKFMEFIASLHSHNITFQYLDGSPSWGHQNYDVFTLMDTVKAYNDSVPAEAKIDGIHLDVEPHTLPIWGTNPKFKLKFFESIEKYGKRMREINPSLVFGIDIPTFYTGEEIDRLAAATDYLTLMNYTDNAVLMAKRAQKFYDTANRLNKRVESGIETQPSTPKWGVTPPITFWEEGWEIMEQRLKVAESMMAKNPSYIGLAIHYYDSYKKMNKGRTEIHDPNTYPIQPTVDIPYLYEGIIIDGNLDDWKQYTPLTIGLKEHLIYEISPNLWGNANNLGCKAYLGWTDQGFYAAFAVSDDTVVQNFSDEDIVNGDHIEFWLDIDYEGDETQPYINEDDFQFGISPGNFSTVEKSICLWVPAMAEPPAFDTISFQSVKSEKGYILELFIPFTFFGTGFSFNANDKIRFNIDPSDTDGDNNLQEILLSSSICRQYGNPRSFRTGLLKK